MAEKPGDLRLIPRLAKSSIKKNENLPLTVMVVGIQIIIRLFVSRECLHFFIRKMFTLSIKNINKQSSSYTVTAYEIKF